MRLQPSAECGTVRAKMQSNTTLPFIDILNVYVSPSIIAFGLPGNLLTALVFMRTNLKKHSASFYLGSLAIADSCYLLFLLITILAFHQILDVYNVNQTACQLVHYAGNVFASWSVWLIVAFTTERYIALTYPLHRPLLCTVTKAKLITFGLLVTACVGNLYIFWVAGLDEVGDCMPNIEFIEFNHLMNYIDTLLTSVLPTIAIIVLNALIWRVVNRYRANLFLHQVEDECVSVSASARSFELKCERPNRRVGSEISDQSAQKAGLRDRRTMMARSQSNITKLILLTSTAFLVLNIPSYIMRLITYTYDDWKETLGIIYAQRIVQISYQANFSINFLLYAMCGTTFREALRAYVHQNIQHVKKRLRCSQ